METRTITTTQRLPELTNQALQTELNKSKELIDNFIYSCSHGLRSPIKSMKGLIMLIKQCASDNCTDRQLYARLLNNSILKAQSILEQFENLACATIDHPPNELIHFSPLLKSIMKDLKVKVNADKISIHIVQKGNFYSYAVGLRSILSQLLSNAVIFQRQEESIEKIAVFVTASQYGCSIQVHDHGIGIAPAIIEKIFTLFYRGSEKSKGTGMGLYIAREVTNKMDGSLSVQSSELDGSVFSLWLPNQVKGAHPGYRL